MLEFFFWTFEKEKQTKCQDNFSNLLISTKVLATEHFLYLINQLIYFRYSWTLVFPPGLSLSFVIKDQCRAFHNAQGQEVVTRWPIILITCWRLFCHYRYLLRLLRSSDLRADFTNYLKHLFAYFRCLIFGIDLLLRLFRLIIDHNQTFPSCSVNVLAAFHSVSTDHHLLCLFPDERTKSRCSVCVIIIIKCLWDIYYSYRHLCKKRIFLLLPERVLTMFLSLLVDLRHLQYFYHQETKRWFHFLGLFGDRWRIGGWK